MSEGQEQRGWLAAILKCDATDVALQLIAGDASPRKFYRVSGPASGSRVLMVSPPSENNERFVLIQRTLEGAGVRVPTMPGLIWPWVIFYWRTWVTPPFPWR